MKNNPLRHQVSIPDEAAAHLQIRYEPGWTGAFTRHQDPAALFANGTRIQKAKTGPKDVTPLGTLGTVLGSMYYSELGVAYFIEWDDKPRTAVFIIGWKIALAQP